MEVNFVDGVVEIEQRVGTDIHNRMLEVVVNFGWLVEFVHEELVHVVAVTNHGKVVMILVVVIVYEV